MPETGIQGAELEARWRAAVALHQAGNVKAACEHYEGLRRAVPEHPELLYLLGAARLQLSETQVAIGLLERSLTLRPGYAPAIDLLANALLRTAQASLQNNDPERALHTFRQVIEHAPGNVDAALGTGRALAALGRLAEADATVRAALAQSPKAAAGWVTLGNIQGQQHRFAEAEASARAALRIDPSLAAAQELLALALHRQGRHGAAVPAYRTLLQTDPAHVSGLLGLAECLLTTGLLSEAEERADKAIAIAPTAKALTLRGRIAEARGAPATAIAFHDQALQRDPAHVNAYVNRGTARRYAGDFEGALADFEAALKLDPDRPAALANKGLTLLALGRLSDGWAAFRARVHARDGDPNYAGSTRWDGTALSGKRVLAWTEYGLGDQILAAGLVPDLLRARVACTVICSPRLHGVLRRSFPDVVLAAPGSLPPEPYDVRLPLMDAAGWLRPDFASFAGTAAYLKAGPRAAELNARYRTRNSPVVGVSWRSTAEETGAFKSIGPATLAPLLRQCDATFVSLQYGDVAADLAAMQKAGAQDVIVDAAVSTAGDLDDFVDQVAAMDLVITISNTTAHVAGALGVPTLLLLPKQQGNHWYWFSDRADCPWYPSVRIIRQHTQGEWGPVIAEAAMQLRAFGERS